MAQQTFETVVERSLPLPVRVVASSEFGTVGLMGFSGMYDIEKIFTPEEAAKREAARQAEAAQRASKATPSVESEFDLRGAFVGGDSLAVEERR